MPKGQPETIPDDGLSTRQRRNRPLAASIAAASVLAKVTRDRIMVDLDARYPGYGFAAHKGYGTARHARAIEELGPSDIHRMSYANVRRAAQAHSRSTR